MLSLSLVGDRELLERLDGVPASVLAAVGATARQQAINLAGYIKTEKLSGQVLGRRSGNLSASIGARDPEYTSDSVKAKVTSSGDVKYAAFWEFGFRGTENVKAHDRVSEMVFGRRVSPFTQHVRAHTRKVDQAARPFMRPSLQENAAEIAQALRDAAVGGAAKALGRT